MPADLTREEIERMRDLAAMLDTEARATMTEFGQAERLLRAIGRVGPQWVALVDSALSEPTRLAQARAEGYEEGAQDAHSAHIRHHDRIREIMGIPINLGSHDWRHNPAHLIDTTDLRDAYDTLVVLIGEKIKPHAEAARAEGYREGVEAAKVVAKRWYDSFEEGRDRATATLAHVEAARLHTQAVGVSVVLASLNALTAPPAEPAGGTAEPADWTVSDTELARDILCYLGIGSDASLEPGDRRRDRIAAMICADREWRIVKLVICIAVLEAQNARLTAEPSDEDVEVAWDRAWEAFPGKPAVKAALTAFLERRMKG